MSASISRESERVVLREHETFIHLSIPPSISITYFTCVCITCRLHVTPNLGKFRNIMIVGEFPVTLLACKYLWVGMCLWRNRALSSLFPLHRKKHSSNRWATMVEMEVMEWHRLFAAGGRYACWGMSWRTWLFISRIKLLFSYQIFYETEMQSNY